MCVVGVCDGLSFICVCSCICVVRECVGVKGVEWGFRYGVLGLGVYVSRVWGVNAVESVG